MKKELFEQKLSEVCEWQLEPVVTPYKNAKYRDEEEEDFLLNRETTPLQITKLKCLDEVCVDCGKLCEGGRKMEKKMYSWNKPSKRHWRRKCVTCGTFENPQGEFGFNGYEANQLWNDRLRYEKNNDEEE